MTPQELSSYEDLSAKLAIDQLRLDEEVISLPPLLWEVNEHTAASIWVKDAAQLALKMKIAEISHAIREAAAAANKRTTEAQIDAEITLHPQVHKAQIEFEDAKYDVGRWQALSEAVRNKGYALKSLSDLVISGYLTPNALIDKRKQELKHKRVRLDEEYGRA